MTTLQKIVKEAKALRKKYPKKYAKWTDYVKAASKKISGLDKVTKTGNKTTVHYTKKAPATKKKAAPKKTVQSSLFGVKKKAAPRSSHKDTKSHNVNIRVVSGVGSALTMRDYLEKSIISQTKKYNELKEKKRKKTITEEEKNLLIFYPSFIRQAKQQLSLQNKLIAKSIK
jgi:ribosomal protein L34E